MTEDERVLQALPDGNVREQLEAFHQGIHGRAFALLGLHREGDEAVFRVWAPRADGVSVCGDFTDWQRAPIPMHRISEGGVFEARLAADRVRAGQNYKYLIRRGGVLLMQADPFAHALQTPPDTASVVCPIGGYRWRDGAWLQYRATRFVREAAIRQPIHIYRLDVGSWRRHDDGRPYSYVDLGADLLPYVKQMGYTHIELMPITERSTDAADAGAPSGLYAPTARCGTPTELMQLIDMAHEAGIGVILDLCLVCFRADGYGLSCFDGTPLYEREGGACGVGQDPQLRFFDTDRPEVVDFLLSCALFWASVYHVDGISVELGDGHGVGQARLWGLLSDHMRRHCPDVMLLGDGEVCDGASDFTLLRQDGQIREALLHAEESVGQTARRLMGDASHGRALLSLFHDAMTARYEQNFAALRCFCTYVMTLPGKKRLTMGDEIGQFRTRHAVGGVEWGLLDDVRHARLQLFIAAINSLYLRTPALWESDGDGESLRPIDAEGLPSGISVCRRTDACGEELTVVLNFLPVGHEALSLPASEDARLEELLNTDERRFGGEGMTNPGLLCPREGERGIRLRVPPVSALILRRVRDAAASETGRLSRPRK